MSNIKQRMKSHLVCEKAKISAAKKKKYRNDLNERLRIRHKTERKKSNAN